jgi:hypothetical protein
MHLLTLHLAVLALADSAATATRRRLRQQRTQHREAGLSTLEITILALGLFLIAGIAVAVLTGAVNSRLDRIT